MPRPDRLGAALGMAGAAGNVVAVALLGDVAGAYRLGGLDAWAASAPAHPAASVSSAVAFTVGLLALAGWAAALGRRVRHPLARLGATWMAVGAILNAAGTVTPAVLVLHVAPACGGEACLPTARALLGLTLTLDALFNLLFGLGLVAAAVALGRVERRPALSVLGIAAGLASLPVSLQFVLDAASDLLVVAGPLWLAFVIWSSVLLWRGGPRRGHVAGRST
jgi:hypothetical protein